MDFAQAELRVKELRGTLEENSRRYYVDNAPLISDFEYDALMRELEELEKAFPALATDDSPTRKVGSDLDAPVGPNAESASRNDFVQRPHKYPMLSLSNTYSIAEIEEFAARADKSLGQAFSYCCELKFDGTSICLSYKNGKLVRALTRGDGVKGDDVTQNAMQISNIPHTLKGDFPQEFEIRGEILMPYEAFDRLNAERERDEQPPFANPRNAASGSLKLIDPQQVAHRGLVCTLYHIPAQCLEGYSTHSEALDAARSWGLPVSERKRICRDIDEIKDYINYWDSERKFLPFATDGIVIKIHELDAQLSLGYTATSPRWAVAFKFKAERACTRLNFISYQVGRTGAVTPVANLEPVQLGGTVVKRATLVNEDMINSLDIREGDYVYVEKGGEIIPKITGVDTAKRPADSVKPRFPEFCPDFGARLVREPGEAKWFCPDGDNCPQQIKGRLLHFTSRRAMDILAGESTVEQLFNLSLVRTPADLYSLSPTQLLTLDGWKQKSVQRFLDSLAHSREVPFDRVLFALGIRFVGETTARELARHFGSIDALIAASYDNLLEVSDVGEIIAASVFDFLKNENHRSEIERLKAAGLQFTLSEDNSIKGDSLSGKTIVVSGNFSVSRDEIKALIAANGGRNSSSLSSKTSFLLAGSKPGPEKLRKCAELGIEIIDEQTLRSMIGDQKPESPDETLAPGTELSLF